MNLKELSKKLNLSISTVSKALRDSPEISATTKNKVQKKAKELNYYANPFASNLRNQQSKTIALIVPEIANNFFSVAINGAESFAQEKGYHVLIYQTNEDAQKEKAIAKYLLNGRVDGVMISLSNKTTDVKHLKELQQREIPLVFFDRASNKIDLPRVTTDDYDSAFMGTEHLIKNGIKDIAFLSISKSLSISNERTQGYLGALKKNKILAEKKRIVFCDGSRTANKNAIKKVLLQKNKPAALFACVEELAILCYEVCEELALKIPTDIKIISYSNLKTAGILNPSLTTITQPAYEIGREAASILFKLIDKESIAANDKNIVLKSTLIVRNSTKVK
jgi:LacI family transcriptional regulator